MYRLLSSKENELPPIQFTVVSEKCRNQFVALVYRVVEELKISDPSVICDDIKLNLGLEPRSLNEYYDWDELKTIAFNLDDTQFKDFMDLICQIFYDIKKENKRFDYDSFREDVDMLLRENGLGYKVHDGCLVKYMDPYEYKRIVEPGFELLEELGFVSSKQHMLDAFESFKSGNNPAALVEATKSLESTIDEIASRMRISIEKKNGLNSKVSVLMENGLCPRYNESFFNALTKLLSEAAARNNEGAHSKNGLSTVDDCIVQYAIDQTMSSILFLIRCWVSNNESKKHFL